MSWGQIINKIGFGKIYGSSWVGEYPFLNIVSDANDYDLRVSEDSGVTEAHSCLVNTLNK